MNTDNVSKTLFDFVQTAFWPEEMKQDTISLAREKQLLGRLSSGKGLTQAEVARMDRPDRKLLYELLTQYIMFLTMNPGLRFPDDFLDDASDGELGPALLAYIAEHSWPFPQLLPSRSMH
ncbi:MAG: hypothetical protein AB1450_13180 [Pseudomonadota bacterium]